MSILTIDSGNSSCKLQLWEKGEVEKRKTLQSPDWEELSSIIDSWKPDGCAISVVGPFNARLIETLRNQVKGDFFVLTPSVALPIKISYESRETLGSDRIAACVGAVASFPCEALLVVDCGTAMTIDVVDAKGTFRGGNISPGVFLRFKSLKESTELLPMVAMIGDIPSFGYNTETAIRSGVVSGVLDEIEGAFYRASSQYGVQKIVMSGGEGEFLTTMLLQDNFDAVFMPDIIGKGLVSIFEYNLAVR